MKQVKRSYIVVAALILVGFLGLQVAQAGIIEAADIADGTSTYTTGDGLVTLTPYAAGLTNGGAFGATASLFGVFGGSNNNGVDDVDGNPFTTDDREALDIAMDGTVGLTQISFVWSRANGPVSNGVPSGIVISGFTADPGLLYVGSTYTNGSLYLNYNYDGGAGRTFDFSNPAASTGQVLRLSVNDFDETGPLAAITSIGYDEPSTATPSGVIVASDITPGASSYATGDGLVSLTPYSAVSNLVVGTFGSATKLFGVVGGQNDNTINDADGNPFTTDDRQAIDITLSGDTGLSQIAFSYSRADGPVSNGVPSGIVISGFLSDPGVSTASGVSNTYVNGTVYLSYNWDFGFVREFSFSNLVASAGQTLRLSANDFNESNAQVGVYSIGYDRYYTAQPALLSIANDAGEVSVSATNMVAGGGVINTLQGATDLIIADWVDMGSATGVEYMTWPISESETNRFFRVMSN